MKKKKPIKIKYKYVKDDKKLEQGLRFLAKDLKENFNKIKKLADKKKGQK